MTQEALILNEQEAKVIYLSLMELESQCEADLAGLTLITGEKSEHDTLCTQFTLLSTIQDLKQTIAALFDNSITK